MILWLSLDYFLPFLVFFSLSWCPTICGAEALYGSEVPRAHCQHTLTHFPEVLPPRAAWLMGLISTDLPEWPQDGLEPIRGGQQEQVMQHSWLEHWLCSNYPTHFPPQQDILCPVPPVPTQEGGPGRGEVGSCLYLGANGAWTAAQRCFEEFAALTSLWNKFGKCASLWSCNFYSNKIIYTQSKDLQRFFSLPERLFYQPKTSLLITWNYWLAGFPHVLTVLLQLRFLVRERNNWHSTSFPYKCQHLCSSHSPSHPQNPALFTSL